MPSARMPAIYDHQMRAGRHDHLHGGLVISVLVVDGSTLAHKVLNDFQVALPSSEVQRRSLIVILAENQVSIKSAANLGTRQAVLAQQARRSA